MHARKKDRREQALKRWEAHLVLCKESKLKEGYTRAMQDQGIKTAEREILALKRVLGLLNVKSDAEMAAEQLASQQRAMGAG